MPNMTNFVQLLDRLQSSHLTVDKNRCVVVRNRNATCSRCVEACTTGCISAENNELVVTPEKCIGCGTCSTVCPTGVYEVHRPSDADLFHTARAAFKACEGEAVIACSEVLHAASGLYDPDKIASVACLGRVDESAIVALAAAGAKHVCLVSGNCGQCTHITGRETAQMVCKTANQLLETWNSEARATVSQKFPGVVRAPEKSYDASKREFFATAKDDAKILASVTADQALKDTLGQGEEPESQPLFVHVMEDGTLPHHVPQRRKILLASLARLGQPQDVMIDTRLWGHVIIDAETCVSCQMCATFCPTGAISKFEDPDGVFGIKHRPKDCVKCRCCTEICPAGALSLSEEVFAVDMLAGVTDRYEMRPVENKPGNDPHQVWHTMKKLIGGTQVYER